MKRTATLLAAGLALLAVIETANALLAPLRVASAADWDAAAAEVRGEFRDGDLIVFAPYWADQVGRRHLGDKIPVEMAARADADRYARIWEVSIRGAHAPEIAQAKKVREARHGKVTVALYEQPAAQIAYDFTTRAEDARVLAGTQPCYKDATGFRCGASRVEPRILEIDYRPRRGILVPVEAGRTTQLEWSDVPLGKTLVGYTGIHDYYARKNADGAVDFRLLVDGKQQLALKTRNEDGWLRFTADTSPLAGGKHTVRVEISAANPAWRNLGFHLEARQ